MTLFFRHPFLCIIMQSEILIYVFFCLEFKSVIYTNISDGILHILKYIYNLEKIVAALLQCNLLLTAFVSFYNFYRLMKNL